jgi:hypothetical protein
VEQEGNKSNMLNPLQEYLGEVLELRLDNSNPKSLVEKQVHKFLRISKRTCNRYKRIVPAKECYSVATREENKNTLFLILDIEYQKELQEVGLQGYEVADEGDQAMEGSKDHEIPHEIIQEREEGQMYNNKPIEREYQVTEVLESRRLP